MFNSLAGANLYHSILLVGAVAALALIGGLAIFCFTKAFGIVFLGEPRTETAVHAREVSSSMIIPQLVTVALILLIGTGSPLVVKPVFEIVARTWNLGALPMVTGAFTANLTQISLAGGIFIVLLTALLLYRRYHLSRRSVTSGPTWGCGYTAATPKQQYTATSFAYNYNHLAKPLLQTRKEMDDIGEGEIFPRRRSFISHSEDFFRRVLIDRPADWTAGLLKKIAVMQTGQIRHYILYAFLFMLLVLLLAMLNIL
jgi:hypothetical protein